MATKAKRQKTTNQKPAPSATPILSTPPTATPGSSQMAEDFLKLTDALCTDLRQLKFVDPVAYVYNPLEYAKEPHEDYVRKFCNSPKEVLLMGMNPGPFGMAQNGVPFGEYDFVINWMKITGNVGKPPKEHPKRQIIGMDCQRSEVSGNRFWTLWKSLCQTPEAFFSHTFVYNYCPLVFMMESSKNITPPMLKANMRDPLMNICDDFICKMIKLLGIKVVVGIGKFAEQRTQKALKNAGIEDVKVVSIMHPSPINPAANKGWNQIVIKQLTELDLIQYYKPS
ncbi:single-strand selective monofunctional uracil DNA glycosylase-like [Amphiura filiformis]|uniref:single-strand selective monofunctional uracil DNA glycosylase-like n=1 Tax=Amphiura filiformis TaxID=82378 RepID=UPI003B21CAD7